MEKVLKLYKYIDGSNDAPFPNVEYQAVVSDFRYDVKRMGGAPIITCTVMHTLCLDKLWSENVYAYFNGERFFIKQIPTSSYNNTDSRYKHELELVSERFVLDNVYFYDVVDSSENNDKPVSNSSKFSFFGDINEFASRLNQSLQYSNVDYSVVVDDGISSEAKMVSFQDQFFSGAIQEGYNTYNVPFYFEGKVIHFGYTNNAITHTFKYGQDESLLSIQKQNANYKVVNRVTGVGSADNIPYYYPNDYESKEEVEANGGTWVNPQTNLMPSIYRESLGKERFYEALNNAYQIPGSDEYYEFENPYIVGKPKEHIVNFDYIKPTIKGITNSEGLRIDMFKEFAYDANDNDEVDEEGNYLHPYFFAKLRKFDGEHGFNLFDHAIDEQEMVISMTSGSCGACEFAIGVDETTQKNPVQVDDEGNLKRDKDGNVIVSGTHQDVQNNTQENEVWIALKKDIDTFGVVMPNASKNYRPSTNDTFVILHIDLPKAYILAAEDKLKEELIKYMSLNNSEKFNFSISFSRIFFAENPKILEQLNENARIQIEYDNTTYELYISSYSYSMSKDAPLPEIRIELSDTLTISQNALQTAIGDVKNEILSSIGGSANIDILKQGLRYFLRKDKDDKTTHNLGVGKSLSVGENLDVKGSASIQEGLSIGGNIESKDFAEGTEKGGYAIRKNSEEQYEVESDNIIARILAKTYDLLVQNHATFVGDLSSEEFISGFMGGKGWSIRTKEILNAEGINEKKSVAEFDDLIVRGSMRIYEFIVSQLLGENDNRIFTGMMEVDHYDANDGKVYLKTDNGRLYNPFRVDDVIIVQQYGGNHSQESGYYVTTQYEFIVTEVGVGEQGEDRLDWVRFRNFTTSMEGGNEELITEHDTLVRIDNISDANRKGIIQLMSVGEDTPYMDFIYGAKTDPENSLKGRLGNLGGVYNPLFGWLKEFGAYLTNLYAVGEFVIAHTGENVSDSIEIAKGQFRTNYRQTTYDMSEEQNFFTNASMTNNCEHWVLGSDATEYFMVDELPQFFNFDLYASEQTYAGLSEWKGRDMLRLSKSSIMQANSLIDKAGTHKVYTGSVENDDGSYTDTYEEVADTLYLSVRFFVSVSGKLEFGFVENGKFIDNSFHYSSNVTAREDGYEVKLSGIWDGKGDFTITSTGDVYVDLLSLTDKPLDNFKITTETKIEQDAIRISLLGKKINGVEGSVTDLGIELNAAEERITAYVNKEIQGVESSVSSLEVGVGEIRTTVASVQGTANDAKNLANAAQSAANDAASKALAAQTTANSANSKADANATAIAQTESSISLLAGAFTLKDGKYVLTSAAGAVITSEVASIYATKSNVNSLGERVSTAESRITTTANSISALTSKITFDSNGNITNINKSGLMVESNFASMFSTQVTAQGIAKTASLTSYVAKTELGDLVSKIEISADQIDLEGAVTFSMLDSGTQSTINSKVTQSAVDSSINTFKGTIIEGGKIKTELLEVTEIYATEGTVGGFTINEDSLVNTGVGDKESGASILIKSADSSRSAALYGGDSNIAASFKNTKGVAVFIESEGNSDACGIEIYGSGQGEAIRSYGTSAFATKSGEHTFISGLSLSVQQGVSWLRTSTDNHFSANDNVDFLIVTGSSTLPAANQNKGRLVFATVRGSQAVLTVNGVYLSEGTYKSSATWTGGDSIFFISDGTYWYEFFCS